MPIASESKKSVELRTPVKYKYAIKYYLDQMPKAEAAEFFASFQEKVGATVRTFYNWCEILISDDYFIPAQKLQALADHMGVPVSKLKNFIITEKKQ
jgi:hypothetical protein